SVQRLFNLASLFLFINHSLENIICCLNLADVKYPSRRFKENIEKKPGARLHTSTEQEFPPL
ncbi:MAG: hypothetical protein WA915_03080, partial [Candidatus Aminicenantaceae bacterium]